MSEQTDSQIIVERNRLKRLSVTISMTAKSGYSSKTVFNNRGCAKGAEPTDILIKAIEQLAFIAYCNVTPIDALEAFNKGLQRAAMIEMDSDIPW